VSGIETPQERFPTLLPHRGRLPGLRPGDDGALPRPGKRVGASHFSGGFGGWREPGGEWAGQVPPPGPRFVRFLLNFQATVDRLAPGRTSLWTPSPTFRRRPWWTLSGRPLVETIRASVLKV